MVSSPAQHAAARKTATELSPSPTADAPGGHDRNRGRSSSSGSFPHLEPDLHDSDDEDDDDGAYGEPAPGESTTTTHFDLCGSMYKRRGGLRKKKGEQNWVIRSFTLAGPVLCYYAEPALSSSVFEDPAKKPRARLNLSKTETIAEMHSKCKPGLPTEDLLTINIYDPILHSKKKWEMCCTSKEQQKVWYRAINAYNGKREKGQGASANEADLATIGSPAPPPLRLRPQMSDLSNDGGRPTSVGADGPRRPSSARAAASFDEVELVARAAARAAEILQEKAPPRPPAPDGPLSTWYAVATTAAALNGAVYLVRHGSERTCQAAWVLANVVLLYLAAQQRAAAAPKIPRKGPRARAAAAAKTQRRGKSSPAPPSPKQTRGEPCPTPAARRFATKLPAGRTMPRAAPAKHGALEAQLRPHPPGSLAAVRACAAAPPSAIPLPQPHAYAASDARLFNLRVGPGYKKTKKKAPSGPALYDLVSADFLYADAPLARFADKFRLPTLPGLTDVDTGVAHVPPLLVINSWLPGEEPSMFGGKGAGEGETYSLPLVFALSRDTVAQLRDLDNASPGVRLLSEWCRRGEKEADFRGRFKCMGMIENIEASGVPKFIQGYNGKPALVTKSGAFTRHATHIEFAINIHKWAYLARKGLYTLTPSFPDFVLNLGFTIEARKDEEMPEVLLGGCRILNLDPEKAVVDGVDDEEL